VGEADAGPYIAMEYLEGPTLDQVMAEGKPVPLREAVVYAIQLAEALDYSHERGIVHRDVKPSNIISLGDSRDAIRITDFGIAHMETAGMAQRTIMGTVMGTPQYMSPEQVEGLPVDGRSDLFSLGVILYQLVSGEKPFASSTLTSLLLKIVKDDPIPIADKVADVPQSLQKIIIRLLGKRPEQRFQTGKELAQQLRRVVHEIDEKTQHGSEESILPLRFQWTAVMAVVVSTAMILGSYLVYTKQVDAMTELALDSGGSLAQFIAVESAEPLLIEDWVALETFVHEVKERQQISYLRITDHKKILRASTNQDEVGQVLPDSEPGKVLRQAEDILITQGEWQKTAVFDFQVPLRFQGKLIGMLQLGISPGALNAAANLTFYTMLALLVAVVLTVAIVAYLLAARITLPIRMLRSALAHIQHGNLNHRIKAGRNDEFGLLFAEYNRMAETLALAQEKLIQQVVEPATPPLTPGSESAEPPPETQAATIAERFDTDPQQQQDDATRILSPKMGKS